MSLGLIAGGGVVLCLLLEGACLYFELLWHDHSRDDGPKADRRNWPPPR